MLKRLLSLAAALSCFAAAPAWATSPFLQSTPGTAFNLLTTEINTLGSGACATSSVGGTSGTFTQTNNLSYPWGQPSFTAGGAFTPAAGQALLGWFTESNGTAVETPVATCSTTTPPFSRGPDFSIPLVTAAYASSNVVLAQGRTVAMPWGSYKVVLWNAGTGGAVTALPASGNIITIVPEAIIY